MSNENLQHTDDASKDTPAQVNPASLVKTPDLSVKLEHSKAQQRAPSNDGALAVSKTISALLNPRTGGIEIAASEISHGLGVAEVVCTIGEV